MVDGGVVIQFIVEYFFVLFVSSDYVGGLNSPFRENVVSVLY